MILLMDIIKKELGKVKEYILEGFSEPLTNEQLKNFLIGKSKMVRSVLAILWLRANGFELTENIYRILASGEIIHNASLLHDDVIDDAETRRGDETVAKAFDSKVSVLAGDYLVSLAVEKLASVNNQRIINIFNNCIKNMSLSEIKQYFMRGKIQTIEEYIEICKGKTAGLFSAILEAVLLLVNGDFDLARSFGELFGIYFQIKNDLEEESAKNDKQNGVYTAKDIIGIENTLILSDNYRSKLKEMLNSLSDNEYKRGLEDLIQ